MIAHNKKNKKFPKKSSKRSIARFNSRIPVLKGYESPILPKVHPNQTLKHLKKLLHKLKNNYGWFIMSVEGECLYCQLRRNESEEKIIFEAVSHYYNECLTKN